MKRKTQRLWIILTCMMGFAIAVALILSAFSSNLVYFKVPSQLINQSISNSTTIRMGEKVVAKSLHHQNDQHTPIAK